MTKKTEEVKELTKEELFKQDPDNFVHLKDMLVAVSKPGEDGHRILINTESASEMGGVLFMLERHCNHFLDKLALKKLQDKKIIKEVANIIGGKK